MQNFPSITVLRVQSNNHKDEIACVTLAPGTFYEEDTFSTVINRDKKLHRGDQEKDLQIIYSLLNNRFWFAFDIELAWKIVQRIYENLNQLPPQTLGLLDALQIFKSTFSVPCDSLTAAARHLHIFPWDKQNNDVRTECNITYQVLNRITLNSALRQWVQPNQHNTTFPHSNAHIASHQEISTNYNEPVDNSSQQRQTFGGNQNVHSSTDSPINEMNYEIPSSHITATNGSDMRLRQDPNVGVQHPMEINDANKSGVSSTDLEQNFKPTHEHNTAGIIQSSQEINVDDSQNVDVDDKESEEYNEEYECPYSSKDEEQYEEEPSDLQQSNQTENMDNINVAHDTKINGDEDRNDKLLSGTTQSNPIQTRNVHSDNLQTKEIENHNNHATNPKKSTPASWKDLAKRAQPLTSTARSSQLNVIASVARTKKFSNGKAHSKPSPSITDPQMIKQHITNAMTSGRTIWISYDGGRQPLVPRGVKPIQWDDHPGTEAFWGIPHRSQTGNKSKFFLENVKEVRDKFWLRPGDERPREKKQKPKTKREGDEKKSNNNNTTANTDNNNNIQTSKNEGDARSKPKSRPIATKK